MHNPDTPSCKHHLPRYPDGKFAADAFGLSCDELPLIASGYSSVIKACVQKALLIDILTMALRLV